MSGEDNPTCTYTEGEETVYFHYILIVFLHRFILISLYIFCKIKKNLMKTLHYIFLR